MVTNVPEPNGGCYLLAYEILNYCAACDLCNTTLKGNYFPIAGAYNFAADTPAALAAEQPLLLFPLVDDPEQFVDFYGVSPRPVSQQAQIRDRALVTIEFFKLDDVNSRKHLVPERAQLITGLFPQLETMCGAGPPLDKQIASDLVFSYLASSSPHANCMRSFVLLFFTAPQEARDIYELAAHFVATTS